MSDPTDIDAIENAETLRARAALAAQKAETEDAQWLMATKRGRRVVWRLLSSAGVFQLSFNTNAMTMAFNEGRRSEGLSLLATIMRSCPAQYAEMTKENG